MADIKKKNLLLFFDRPTEPCFMQKGEEKVVFDIPDHYYPEKYKALSSSLSNRFGNDAKRTIPIRNIALPNLNFAKQLPYNDQFSVFLPTHRQMAGRLIDIFLGMRDIDDLTSILSYCQLHINPYMFNYCLSVALLHRDDTKGMNIPTLTETFPDKFMDPKVFRQARQSTNVVKKGPRLPVTIPQNLTASDQEPEQRVAYFREDIAINLHHWHWHLVYPFDLSTGGIVDKDRRGELFYYMHQQIVARYNIERFCNDLPRVVMFKDLRAPIEEAYFPKLDSKVASRAWPPRFPGSVIVDLDRPVEQIKIEVSEMERWRDCIIQAIEENAVLLPGTSGRKMPLNPETGIDILGNIMESSILSVNRGYYGDYHNMGHVFISYVHDPDHRNLERPGVIGDSATAMRDPIFYRWHAHIDDIFQMYKNKLPPYTRNNIVYDNINVTSIKVEGPAGTNVFGTFWERSTVELGRGMDFTPRGSVQARFTHLQHEEFNYVIEVNNKSGNYAMTTVRIFMAPVFDDNGNTMTFDVQRKLMIELDKFTQSLKHGMNTIRRRSLDSSVTIPYERSFRNQLNRSGTAGDQSVAEFDFCGCGWPHHMLLPKGTTKGYPVTLFVMLSNWDDDRISQDLVGTCNDAASYCGIRDRRYPDRRPMGFPFDRPGAPHVKNLQNFITENMAITDCTIRFTDEIRDRKQ
ncbi:phenoloxidase subunit 1-like [Papilio machaon]|uniref:phenoloxidase subunit 1-like n=1 Tax=Papilio machaon TaxID=76193 RepID=UPI001E664296|nr:phenoloxidase subunit 1-like [Papilio machaon]